MNAIEVVVPNEVSAPHERPYPPEGSLDSKSAGLKFGIEIHQRLDTPKLFCRCSSEIKELEPNYTFSRNLRAIFGELGEVDPAALFEFTRGRRFAYQCFDGEACAIEMDEEPPHPVDQKALEIAAKVALMLNCELPDEIHVMRKTVIDGSNTSGFQRTAVIGFNGKLEDTGVSIPTVCLEEESAGIVETKTSEVTYALDRLGIPLVEIATGVMEGDPSKAKDVAARLGLLLRSTGQVKRGIGTIRQDVNVSVAGGERIEIKGVQSLDLIPAYIENEAKRQLSLIQIRDELKRRGVKPQELSDKIYDITPVFKDTGSKLVSGAINSGNGIFAVRLAGLAGLFRKELYPAKTLGSEIADVARTEAGVKGIIHTDELPNYGITDSEVEKIRKAVSFERGELIAFVFGDKKTAETALNAVVKRCRKLFDGVPKETRKALSDGGTGYMRPLPGAARMYPETDVPPILLELSFVEKLKKQLPEKPGVAISRLAKLGISEEAAKELYLSGRDHIFVDAIKHVPPTIAASIMLETAQYLKREGVAVDRIPEEKLKGLFWALGKKKLTKEIVPEVLKSMAENPQRDLEEIIKNLGITGMSEKALGGLVDKIILEKRDYIKQQGVHATAGIMGLVMAQVRGKIDGRLVNKLVEEKVKKIVGGK